MTRFIIFAILLTTQCCGFLCSVYQKVVMDKGKNGYLVVHGNITSLCELERNTGEKYLYYPYDRLGTYTWNRLTYRNYNCSIKISPIHTDDAGTWTITSYLNTANMSQTFKVYVNQPANVIPYSEVEVIEGTFVYGKLNVNLDNVTDCTIVAPNKTQIDLLTVDREDFQRFGKCGFNAMFNNGDNGEWILKAIDDDRLMYTARLYLRVYKESEKPIEIISLKRGVRGELNPLNTSQISACQLIDPSGVRLPMRDSCAHVIPVVTTRLEGVWVAEYVEYGKFNSTTVSFKVVTYSHDSEIIHSKVTHMENGNTQILCHTYVEERGRLSLCYFITPGGRVLKVFPGIRSKDYRAFNVSNPMDVDSNLYCGLTIFSSDFEDGNKPWKCGMFIDNRLERRTVIRLNPNTHVQINAKSVYVKQGDSYKINCAANARLKYCWFRSPNGTAYTTSKTWSEAWLNLKYVDSGLNEGECIAIIRHAEFSDDGTWTCNMGVVDGAEERQSFSVTVTNSYVVASKSRVFAAPSSMPDIVSLTCNILPSVTDREVDYCRWIHPDGYGIHSDIADQYHTYNNNIACTLRILKPNELDFGGWTCVIATSGSAQREESATILYV